MWLASPALPVGGFSYSEGLEAAVDAGLVRDEAAPATGCCDQLQLGLARTDLPVVAQAFPAWRADDVQRIAALNDWVLHTRESAELRQQTEQMGRSLVEWLKNAPAPTTARRAARPRCARRRPGRWPSRWPPRRAARRARRAAGLRLRLGREHGAGRDASRCRWARAPAQRILARLVDAMPGGGRARAPMLADAQRQAFTPMLAHPAGAARDAVLDGLLQRLA